MTTMDFGLRTIGQIAVPVGDLDRATGFYRDQLGMRFLFQVPGMAFFDCRGIRLMLARPEAPEHSHPASPIYYQVEDIASACATLEGRGVTFLAPAHKVADLGDRELWMAFFRDTEENLLAIMSEPLKD